MRFHSKFLSKRAADEFVKSFHRHHRPVNIDIFRVAAFDENESLHGVAQVCRVTARKLDDGYTAEVCRLCSDGTPDICSYLYAKCARIAKEMGFKKIVTYIMESESGTSLKAAGWTYEYTNTGGNWDSPSRPRGTLCPVCPKQRWARKLI